MTHTTLEQWERLGLEEAEKLCVLVKRALALSECLSDLVRSDDMRISSEGLAGTEEIKQTCDLIKAGFKRLSRLSEDGTHPDFEDLSLTDDEVDAILAMPASTLKPRLIDNSDCVRVGEHRIRHSVGRICPKQAQEYRLQAERRLEHIEARVERARTGRNA